MHLSWNSPRSENYVLCMSCVILGERTVVYYTIDVSLSCFLYESLISTWLTHNHCTDAVECSVSSILVCLSAIAIACDLVASLCWAFMTYITCQC